ncbi:MAG: methylmalonyl-CoA mutase family protein [Planctomycetota bacterium]
MSLEDKNRASPIQNTLFQEFASVDSSRWREEVDRLLKGAPYEKRMRTQTPEGITLEPLYRLEDLETIPHVPTLPGSEPFVRGTRSVRDKRNPWIVAQEAGSSEIDRTRMQVDDELAGGATAVHLSLDSASCLGLDPDEAEPELVEAGHASIAALSDLDSIVHHVDLAAVPVFIQCKANGLPFTGMLAAAAAKRGMPAEALSGAIAMDPLGSLAAAGSLPMSLDQAYAEMGEMTAWALKHAPNLRTIWAHGEAYHDSGGTAAQELAFTLAAAVEYLRAMEARGLEIEEIVSMMVFSFSLGSRFFMEVAKVRAARLLWHNILSACGAPKSAGEVRIHARTSRHAMTRYDPYVNLLRATTQAMSGVISGVDSLHVAPFDDPIRPGESFSRRMARNIQLIVKHEARLADTLDPAGGSWFVENLTADLAKAAWAIFQQVEARGGMAKALEQGFPQGCIQEAAAAGDKAAAKRRKIMVGTNQYPNVAEKPLVAAGHDAAAGRAARIAEAARLRSTRKQEPAAALDVLRKAKPGALVEAVKAAALKGATLGEISRALPSRSQKDAATGFRPMEARRASEPFERLRAAVQAAFAKPGGRAAVFLATLGPISRYMPRFDFSASFFEVGGFEVIRTSGFETPRKAADQALAEKARVVVICGLDESYAQGAAEVASRIKEKSPGTQVVLAGLPAPDDEARFRDAGVDLFIHAGADLLDLLTQVATKLEVKL